MNNPLQYLGKLVKVKIDRPLGSLHPEYGFIYEVNYGYIPHTISGDNEELDAYVLGVNTPLFEFEGICTAVLHRTNDNDDKLIIVPPDIYLSDAEIEQQTFFQEKWFHHILVRHKPTIYLICGFLGAGKTTYSEKLAQNTGAIHLNPDKVCMLKYPYEEYENNWETCFAQTIDYLWQEIATYIREHKDVIFDMGFWTKSSREQAVNKVKQLGGNPIIYYIYAPDSILKQRLAQRKGKIAEQNLLHFDTKKKSFEEPSQDEVFVTIKNY